MPRINNVLAKVSREAGVLERQEPWTEIVEKKRGKAAQEDAVKPWRHSKGGVPHVEALLDRTASGCYVGDALCRVDYAGVVIVKV